MEMDEAADASISNLRNVWGSDKDCTYCTGKNAVYIRPGGKKNRVSPQNTFCHSTTTAPNPEAAT